MENKNNKNAKKVMRHIVHSKYLCHLYNWGPVREERRNGKETIFEEKIVENFSKIDERYKITDLRNLEPQVVLIQIKPYLGYQSNTT